MRILLLAACMALGACRFGKVNQGRVVEYRADQGEITLISDSNYRDPAHPRFDVLPAVTIRTPANPAEMGPAPEAGKLLSLDLRSGRAVIYDAASESLRSVPIADVTEAAGVSPGEARARPAEAGRVAVYIAGERKMIRFSVPEEFARLPRDTWQFGDEIRYYYKDPGRALRLMNVTRTDLGKAEK
jgi:hypothetical protein